MGYINIIAVLLSPIIAVQVTKFFDNRKSIYDKKFELFKILMGQRGLFPRSDEFLIALNLIDVVFHDDEKVRNAYSNFYSVSDVSHSENKNSGKYLILLLQEMSKVLKLGNIRDLDVDRNFVTTERINGHVLINDYYNEFLRVLRNSVSFGETKK